MPYCHVCKTFVGSSLEAMQCAYEDVEYRAEFHERQRQAGVRVALEQLSKLSGLVDEIYARHFGVEDVRIQLEKAFDKILRPTPIDEAEARVNRAFDRLLEPRRRA